MPSKKNKWRKRGRLEFRRETKRYSDGTPWGKDVLYVRIRKVDCAIVEPMELESYRAAGNTLSVLPSLGSTYRIDRPSRIPAIIRNCLRGLEL